MLKVFVISMTATKVLKIHLSKYTFPKTPCKDGRYYIKVKDITRKNGRRTLSAKNLDELEELVLCYDTGNLDLQKKTFRHVFRLVQQQYTEGCSGARLAKKQSSVHRHMQTYKRYFADTYFENMCVDEISARDVMEICETACRKYLLKKHELMSIRSAISSVFSYAQTMGWIPAILKTAYDLADFTVCNNLLQKPVRIDQRGYSDDEMNLIFAEIRHTHKTRPDYLPSYGLELQILLGLRRGEVSALMWRDFDEEKKCVYICREQLTMMGTKPLRYCIDDSTKTGRSRKLGITPKIQAVLDAVREAQVRTGRQSEFLFPADTETGCITNAVIPQHFGRICSKIGIPVSKDLIRGTHAFRRNFATDIRNIAGKNDAADMTGHSQDTFDNHYSMGLDVDKMIDYQIRAGR